MKKEYLFVYGSLKKEYNNYYAKFLRKNSLFLKEGYITGKIFQISWYVGLKKSIFKKDKVFGEIYLIKNPKKVFKILDRYEEASKYNIKGYEYKRAKSIVYLNRKKIKAWVYFYKNS